MKRRTAAKQTSRRSFMLTMRARLAFRHALACARLAGDAQNYDELLVYLCRNYQRQVRRRLWKLGKQVPTAEEALAETHPATFDGLPPKKTRTRGNPRLKLKK